MRRGPRLQRVLTVTATATVPVVSVLVGLLATVSAALLWTRPAAVLTAGFLATGATAGVGWSLVCRTLTGRRRRRLTWLGVVTVVLLDAALLLTPMSDPRQSPGPVAGTRYWQLGTGSRLAYLHVPAVGPRRPTPVVVLHGGPGIPDLAADAAFFGRLSRVGFDVYLYDQLGSGGSTRLSDPAGYGVERDSADLEQVRLAIGADRLVLVGHSYGGFLATRYLSEHPEHVASMVLSSPGPLDPADTSDGRATARLTFGDRLRIYSAVLAPRPLLGYALLQVNPTAAHAYLGDAEADARNDTVISRASRGLHCDQTQRPEPVRGSGFYALQFPQSATAPPRPDLRLRLAGIRTPVLLLKGSCDYLSWQSAEDYRQALSETTLVYLPGAGHNTYQDRPAEVMAETQSWLTGRPLPVAPYPDAGVPAGYQAG